MKYTAVVATSTPAHLEGVKRVLETDWECIAATSLDDLIFMLNHTPKSIKLVILDHELVDHSLAVIKSLKKINPFPEWILISEADVDLKGVHDVMKCGISNLLTIPYKPSDLLKAANKTLATSDSTHQFNQSILNPILDSKGYPEMVLKELNSTVDKTVLEKWLALLPSESRFDTTFQTILEEILDPNWETKQHDKLTILSVDDEVGIRMNISEILRLNRHAVILAQNAAEAIAIAKKTNDIDVFLLDIGLPDKSGLELLADLKKLFPDTEAIMLTAFHDTDKVVDSFQNDAFDYLTKPFDNQELLAVIKKAAQRRYLHKVLNTIKTPSLASDSFKLNLLESISKKRFQASQAFQMKDIYLFFPELKASGIPETQLVSKRQLEDGLVYFIEKIKEKVAKSIR